MLASAGYGIVLIALGDVTVPVLKWAVATGTLVVAGTLITALQSQTEKTLTQLGAAARTDSLTGLANRRELEQRFAGELERSTRGGRPLSIAVLDLDWFKEFNDRFGHAAGDRALVHIAQALGRATWTSDVVARLGGEEFAVLAPETDEIEGSCPWKARCQCSGGPFADVLQLAGQLLGGHEVVLVEHHDRLGLDPPGIGLVPWPRGQIGARSSNMWEATRAIAPNACTPVT